MNLKLLSAFALTSSMAVSALIISGCTSVTRVDPSKMQQEYVTLTADDLHQFALEAIDSIKESDFLANVQAAVKEGKSRPAIKIQLLENRTTFDTISISKSWENTIRNGLSTQLVKWIQVVDQGAIGIKVVETDANGESKNGKISVAQVDARYSFSTVVTEIINSRSGVSDYTYLVSASIMNRDTKKSEWALSKEFRKIKEK